MVSEANHGMKRASRVSGEWMHEFKYRHNELYCEGVRVAVIAEKVGTPVYVYSHKTLIDHYEKLKRALAAVRPLICFSVKSNSNIAVLRALVRRGAGLDIVSAGELYRAKRARVRPDRVVYAGVGKKASEIADAMRYGIFFFNVESEEELDRIQKVAKALNKTARVAIRINPDVTPRTHAYVRTGSGDTKFGLDFETAHKLFNLRWKYPNVSISGIHLHVGSQILDARPFVSAIRSVLTFLKERSIDVKYLNIGGGLGIIYSFEKPQTASAFAKKVLPLLKRGRMKILLEPGRFIAGNSGILLTRVIYTKRTPRKRFIIVDSGMNDLIRPSLYEAYHTILPVLRTRFNQRCAEKVDVVGPICESGDFLAKDRLMNRAESGDLLAVMGAGAYGFVMSSNYNSRPRAAEVLVTGTRYSVIRKRETYHDLVRGESIPKGMR